MRRLPAKGRGAQRSGDSPSPLTKLGDRATGQWQVASGSEPPGPAKPSKQQRRSPDQDRTHGEDDGEETANSQLATTSTMYLD